jgi:hypothetical protein
MEIQMILGEIREDSGVKVKPVNSPESQRMPCEETSMVAAFEAFESRPAMPSSSASMRCRSRDSGVVFAAGRILEPR